MRIKKEGFTLIEILAIIIVLTVISSIVIPNVFGMIRNARQKSYETLINDIEGSGRVYTSQYRNDVENSLLSLNYYTITLSDLKREGLLKTPVIDPRTDEVISLTKKLIVTLAEDNTLSICFEDRGCFIPTLLYNKLTENVVSGEIQGLHHDITNNYHYYKGANLNNWALFNDYLWRIVKINEDGTIKLVYEGKKKPNGTVEDGKIGNGVYHISASNDYNTALSIKTTLQNWYNTNITEENKNIVQATNFCIGKTAYSASGVSKATFQSDECSSQTTNSLSVGLISTSEYLNASLDSSCNTSANTTCGNKNYLNKNNYDYWSITGDTTTSNVWSVRNGATTSAPTVEKGIRPVINLKEGTLIFKGDGSFDNPYNIKPTVNIDHEKPVITILGDNPISIEVGSGYVDAGATATDNVDGDLTSRIITISNVNTNIPGVYTVNYMVLDNTGNMSLPTIRIVEVSGGVNPPVLASNMTPIKWNGSEWINTTESDPQWYSYDEINKKWANARTADGSMWVWIPRFIYKISEGWHTATAGTIEVNFSKGLDDTIGGTVTLDTSPGASASNNKWTNHPAFTFGSSELTGFWVAKFEATAAEGITSSLTVCDAEDNSAGKTVKSVFNATAWRCLTIGNMFNAVRNMETNSVYGWDDTGLGIDTHLMKNVEWGAVAYLAKSNYGKSTEVWINNSSTNTTGCAGDAVNDIAYEGCEYAYDTPNGKHASTTDNVYGIYDMSGGAREYVMGNVDNLIASGGIDPTTIGEKYIDRYDTSVNYGYNDSHKGDAIYETSNNISLYIDSTWQGETTGGWYGDYTRFPTTSPWLIRSAHYNDENVAGLFAFTGINGAAHYYNGFRPVLLVYNEAPTITLLGSNPANIFVGDNYNDAGATALDDVDGDVTENIIVSSNVNPSTPGEYTITYNVSDSDGNAADQVTRTVHVISLPPVENFSYTGGSQTYNVTVSGTYKLEVWGAQGGTVTSTIGVGGKGGYSIGHINLTAGETIYVNVGGMPSYSVSASTLLGGFNGGGSSYGNRSWIATDGISWGVNGNYKNAPGGGATDIRRGGNNLNNRIIVAGGGGGGSHNSYSGTVSGSNISAGGAGGGTSGQNGYAVSGSSGGDGAGGTQTAGGSSSGALGIGGNGPNGYGAGGGGGYYGGGYGPGSYSNGYGSGGGGGSGYIGGVTSYGGVTAQTIAGNTSMPAPGGGNETGHSGHGYARITFISP